MGVDMTHQKSKFVKPLTPKQKLRAGVFVVVAALRMNRMEEQWRENRLLGENLKRLKMRQAMKWERSHRYLIDNPFGAILAYIVAWALQETTSPMPHATGPDFKSIMVKPIGTTIGAETTAVDFSKAVSPEVFSEIHTAITKGNSLFHVDSSFNPRRAGYSLLRAHELPPPGYGGNTDFADTRTAYDDLPCSLKQQLEQNDYIGCHNVFHSRKKAVPKDSPWLFPAVIDGDGVM
ncbi:hypothetical protein R6Q59_010124 [Mikania micrantha]